jgi:hypothetical protein
VSFAQVLEIKIEGYDQEIALSAYLAELEKKQPVKFFFVPEWFADFKFESRHKGSSLKEGLNDILRGSDISFALFYDYAVVFIKDPARELERESFLRTARESKQQIVSHTIGSRSGSQKTEKVEVSGTVAEGQGKQPLAGVVVQVRTEAIRVTTDASGRYSVTIPRGSHVVTFQYLNYEEQVIDLHAYEDGSLDVAMMEIPRLLDEVVVSDHQISNVSGKVGITSLKMSEMKKMPAFLGEVDLIKQIQVLPGVTSVGEVSSGFNVRGGSVDQNLVLYDGVQIFNNSHLFGFFSAFSSDAIKDATFFKGGVPAEYGGRISSVLDITSKEGSLEKWSAEGGLGLISSHVTLGGPIKKQSSSAMISFRSSYSDWLLKEFTAGYEDVQNSSVSFYDGSVKLTQKLGGDDKLSFSGYISKDKFRLPNDTTFTWQNLMGSARFDHIFNQRTSSSVVLGFGQYAYQVTDDDPNTAYEMKYRISYPSLKADLSYDAGKHKISIGINSVYYKIAEATLKPTSENSNAAYASTEAQQSVENAIFISDNFDLTDKLHLDLGFRFSMYSSLGPATVRLYEPGGPKNEETATDTISHGDGIIRTYFGPEPRLSLRYTLTQNSSVKISYNRIYQYIHLISNSIAATPIDIWQPSDYHTRPQMADQVSLGYFRDLFESMYEASVEGFYKEFQNTLDFKDAANLVMNPALEQELLTGSGVSYGAEFAVNKTKGRLSGSLNYTYSRSLRKVKGNSEEETLNNGEYFPSNFDQPNIVNANWKYALSRRFSFTGNFTYHTGRPVTIPYSYAVIDNIPVINYTGRNQYRVPDYHRLDIGFVFEGNHKRKKFWDGTWSVSLYNLYARKNVYSIFYAKNEQGLQAPYRMSIVGTVLPSVSYRFKL